MNTRLDYLWEKVSLFTQFSDLAKIFEPIFFKISLKTGPIFDHPLLVKIGSEIRKSVQNRKTDIFSSPGGYYYFIYLLHENLCCGYSLEAPLTTYIFVQKTIDTFPMKNAPYVELWLSYLSSTVKK